MQEFDFSKIVYPTSKCNLKFHVQGIYGFPQQWKTVDQANPSLFTYTVKSWKGQILKGKIYPRQLTEKQLREQQQAKKKGGKKEAKKQQNPQEEEKQRKLKQQQEAEEKIREEQWSKLSEEEKIYRTYQNSFKSSQLKFQHNLIDLQFTAKPYVILQERITKDQGQWVYVYKLPAVNEEQIAKLKKSKPKNLNLNDLNPIIMRGWMNLSELNSKDKNSVTLRCKLVQIDKTAETSEPNLDKTYIKINISLEKPFIKGSDGLQAESFIKNPPKQIPIANQIACVEQLKGQLRLAIESLAMQYASVFWKELNMYQQQKNTLIFTNTKKNQASKRKQQFLYDFNMTGKYKILKDRIKRSIVNICKHKYAEQMSDLPAFTGISYDQKDQLYSQIYQFLVATYKETMATLIWEKMQALGETEVPSQQTQKDKIKAYLNNYLKQELSQKIDRLVNEYQNIYQYKYGEKIYKKYMEQHPKQTLIKYKYAVYCLKNNLALPSSILPYLEQHLQYHKQSSELNLLFLLMLISSEQESSCKKAWVILRQIISKDEHNVDYLMLGSFVLDAYLNNKQLGELYQFLAERSYLRKQGKLGPEGQHKDKPSPSQIPSLSSLATYDIKVSKQIQDQMWVNVAKLFSQYNLIGVISKILNKISNKQNIYIKSIEIKLLLSQGKDEEALTAVTELYEKSPSEEILQLIIRILFKLKNYNELEKYLKISLKLSPPSHPNFTLLRLSLVYIQHQKYANSKACLVKYIEKYPKNSGFSWTYLGYCQLREGNVDSAIQCLRHANLLDPHNPSIWDQLALAYAIKGNFIMVNQTLNQSSFLTEPNDTTNIKVKKQIIAKMSQQRSKDFYKQQIRKRVLKRLNEEIA